MSTYDPIQITKLYLFGTDTPSTDDYNEHIRPWEANISPRVEISYNMHDYMETGAGRYAYPALFEAIKTVFTNPLEDGTYTWGDTRDADGKLILGIQNLLGIPNRDLRLHISQYGTDIFSADHTERSYIFGSTWFRLDLSNASFTVTNGVVTVHNMQVNADDDNFDFNTSNPLAQVVGTVLENFIDPYNLARGVNEGDGKSVIIRYFGQGKIYNDYSQSEFTNQQSAWAYVSYEGNPIKMVLDGDGLEYDILDIPYFLNLISDSFIGNRNEDMKVIYGTPGEDEIDESDAKLNAADNLNFINALPRFLEVGGAGNDNLMGGLNADILLGGRNDDTLTGDLGNDTLEGGTGYDTLKGDDDNDSLDGGEGNDTLEGGADDDTLEGGEDNDTLKGDEGKDTLKGDAGNDTLEGGADDDTLEGGEDNDTLKGEAGKDTLSGGDSNDSLEGGDGEDILKGEAGKDTLKGGDRNDTLEGGDGDDAIYGESGSDTLKGGKGDDTYSVSAGDVIQDFHGREEGSVWQGAMQFVGGDYVSPGLWQDDLGNSYRFIGGNPSLVSGTLIINGSIKIENYKNHDLRIDLGDPKKDDFDGAESVQSPIVLDLNGDGIITTRVSTGAYFDHGNDGFAEQTGWVSGQDGLLALDRDGNGVIDSGRELFGSNSLLNNGQAAANGYVALAEFDVNHDGQIDAQDPVYNQLILWQDQNGDGESQVNELLGLAQASVQSVAVTYTETWIGDHGNALRQVSSFTWSDGSTGQAADVWFSSNEFEALPKQLLPETPDIATLPNATGFRTTYDLHQTMLRDSSGQLQALVQAFVDAPATARRGLVDTIVFTWLGVDDVPADSRGKYIDARQLAVLEQLVGRSYYQFSFNSPNPSSAGAVILKPLYQELADTVYQQLMEGYFASLLNGLVYTWNTDTNHFDVGITAEMVAGLTALYQQGSQGMANIVEFSHTLASYGELGQQVLHHILASDASDELCVLLGANTGYVGTSGANKLQGSVGSDKLFGLAGDDTLEAYAGDDTLIGGTGDDTLKGGEGSDLYRFGLGDGQDVIEDASQQQLAQDSVLFGANISSGDIVWRRDGNDLIIRFNQNARDVITLQAFFTPSNQTTFSRFQFFDNSSIDAAAVKALLLIGNAGSEYLEGYNNSADVLKGMAGNDTLVGQGGSDTYVFELGCERDVIQESGDPSLDQDMVLFGASIGIDDVVWKRDGSNLIIGFKQNTSDKITLLSFFTLTNQTTFNRFQFADSSFLDVATVKALLLIGSAGNEYLEGYNNSSDLLKGLVGNDTLAGLGGSDSYVFELGCGQDVIQDGGDLNLDLNMVSFGAGINRNDIIWMRDSDNLIIKFKQNTSDQITIPLFFTSTNQTTFNRFQFADDSVLDAAAVKAQLLISSSSNEYLKGYNFSSDVYVFAPGWGQDTISNYDIGFAKIDVIQFGTGVASSDILLSRANDDLILTRLGSTDTITIQNYGKAGYYTLDLIRFADGTVWNMSDVKQRVFNPTSTHDSIQGFSSDDVIYGLAGDDTIRGLDGNDVLFGDSGDDTLYISSIERLGNQAYFSGGTGNDSLNFDIGNSAGNEAAVIVGGKGNDQIMTVPNFTFYFERGDGSDVIYFEPTIYSLVNTDTIVFGPGITPNDVQVCRIGLSGLWFDLGGGDQIKYKYSYDQYSSFDVIEQAALQVLFSDGTLWGKQDIVSHLSIFSSADADSLYGTVNTDAISTGDGADKIDGLAGNDILKGETGNDTLYGNDGDDQLLGDSGADSLYGGVGDDTINGGADNDYIEGGIGNDLIDGGAGNDELLGRSGSDIYIFGRGSGQDRVYDTKRSDATQSVENFNLNDTDVIRLALLPHEIVLTRVASSLKISIIGATDQVIVSSWFDQEDLSNTLALEFSDGTIWDTTTIMGLLGSVVGSAQEDRIYGSPGHDNYNGMANNDVIYGNAGNDTLEGGGNIDWDQLRGGRGDDTYVFGYGSGTVRVYENRINGLDSSGSGNDVIQFKPGIRPQDVTLSAVSSTLVVKLAGSPSDTLTIYGQFDYARVEQAKFSDGTIWDLTKGAASPIGTASSELLNGGFYDDVINGLGGRDTIYGNNGFDTLDGGDGNDSLDGGSGNNVLLGSAGNDTLSGASFDFDVLDGGSGNDVINCSGNDIIVFGHGYGNDTVNRNTEADWTIRFNADVLPEQIQLSMVYTNGHSDTLSDGNAETLRIRIADSQESIDISYYDPEQPGAINRLMFADGQVWDAQQIIANIIATPTSGRDILYGGVNNDVLNGLDSNDFIVGLAGNDSLQGGMGVDSVQGSDGDDTIEGGAGGDYLRGGNGHDVYLFGLGDGTDIIESDDSNTGFDTIKFGDGISPDQVLVTSVSWYYLNLSLVIMSPDNQLTSDQVVISGWDRTVPEFNEVKQVEFSDGTIWDITDISNRYWQNSTQDAYISGTDGNDSLPGFASTDRMLGFDGDDYLSGGDADDQLIAGGGNDTLDGGTGFDILNGGLGDDTYLFGRGYGKDLLVDFDKVNAGHDRIVFQGGITSGDISVTHDDAHIFITINDTGDQLKIRWQVHAGYRIEAIEFSDGEIWDAATLAQHAGLVENSAPVLIATLADQAYTEYESFNFTLPNVFTDTDTGDVLSYSASLQDGSILPNWLSFDPVTKSFTGLASEDQVGYISIQVNVADDKGHVNYDIFDLTIRPKPDALLNGTTANDVISAHSGNDTLNGFEGDDVLAGGKGHDFLSAGSGNDSLTGGEGNDTYFFELGFGYDQIESAYTSLTNVDTIVFGASVAETSVRVKLFDDRLRLSIEGSTDTVDFYFSDVNAINLSGITFFNGTTWDLATILAKAKDGTEADDVLIGTRYADVFHGLAGNDNIQGSDGNDTLYGDEGYDWLYGEGGDDRLIGGPGSDGFNGGTGIDTYVIEANWGEDGISDSASSLPLDIIEFAPSLSASSIQLSKYGDSDLVLRLNGTFNTLRVYNFFTAYNCVKEVRFADGTTWDVANMANQINSIDLNAAQTIIGFSYADTLTGLIGNDTLYGLGGDDILYGGQGDDYLDGGIGIDALLGELGNDQYVVDNIYEFVIENPDQGTDLIWASVTFTLPANVEQLSLIGSSALNATGNSLDNVLTGNAGANKLTGGAGNDSYYVSTGDTVVESTSAGTDTVLADINFTLSANVENLTLTGVVAITAVGNTQNNTLTGNSAANTLNGGGGIDTLIGSLGNDSYGVDNALDVVKENLNEGTDLIQSSVTYTLPAQVENLTLTGSSAINGIGNSLNNILTGNSKANSLTGGSGDDTYVIGTGDVVIETSGAGSDSVQASMSYTLANYVEKLTLTGTTAIHATGNELDNTLTGNSAANSLTGGLGNDVLTGGSGADHFVFNTALNAATNKDVIADFNVVDDTIRLENAIMTKLTTTGTLAAARFVANNGGVALDADDYLLYDTSNGNLYYDADGNGAGAKIAIAVLTGVPTLTSADFVVI